MHESVRHGWRAYAAPTDTVDTRSGSGARLSLEEPGGGGSGLAMGDGGGRVGVAGGGGRLGVEGGADELASSCSDSELSFSTAQASIAGRVCFARPIPMP